MQHLRPSRHWNSILSKSKLHKRGSVTLALDDAPVQKATPEKIEVAVADIVEHGPAAKKIESVKIQSAAARPQEALDMMINKSRHAHEKQQTMQRAGLIALVVILLLSAGTYFYMQSSDEYQLPQTALAAPETETPAAVETPQQPQTVAVAAPVTTVVHQSRAPRINKPHQTETVAQAVEAAPLQFSKTTRMDPIEDLLSRAYEKFNAGDYVGANDLYQQVLQREPDNRDGLLGVAAVAVKQQRNEYARQKYLQLLQLDPKDSLARAGLATVAGDAQDETQLKLMLREQPDAPHLYFALGSVYASQQRWSEAQQAFFSAWSGDSNNADYAYNLGVSLDRMGKFKAAAAQYQIALQLNQKRAGNFVATDVDARIQAIGSMTDE